MENLQYEIYVQFLSFKTSINWTKFSSIYDIYIHLTNQKLSIWVFHSVDSVSKNSMVQSNPISGHPLNLIISASSIKLFCKFLVVLFPVLLSVPSCVLHILRKLHPLLLPPPLLLLYKRTKIKRMIIKFSLRKKNSTNKEVWDSNPARRIIPEYKQERRVSSWGSLESFFCLEKARKRTVLETTMAVAKTKDWVELMIQVMLRDDERLNETTKLIFEEALKLKLACAIKRVASNL